MKGLVFFKDGHTEEIVNYVKAGNDIHFETAKDIYTRMRLPGDMGYMFNKIAKNNHIIPINKIQRIDIFD